MISNDNWYNTGIELDIRQFSFVNGFFLFKFFLAVCTAFHGKTGFTLYRNSALDFTIFNINLKFQPASPSCFSRKLNGFFFHLDRDTVVVITVFFLCFFFRSIFRQPFDGINTVVSCFTRTILRQPELFDNMCLFEYIQQGRLLCFHLVTLICFFCLYYFSNKSRWRCTDFSRNKNISALVSRIFFESESVVRNFRWLIF